jgi:hypothetical protein
VRCDHRSIAVTIRATDEERTRPLPGDECIPDPLDTITHAVTIDCPPREVWPWLVQMGAGNRAGWYSYDWLDNGRTPSATRIIPELQHPAVGATFPALPGLTEGFKVEALEPEKRLTLIFPDADGRASSSWTFVLEPIGRHQTRLLVRVRAVEGYRFHGLPALLTKLVMRFVHFVMERKQLIGIIERAESVMSAAHAFAD